MALTFKSSVKSIGADYEEKESFYSKSVVINLKEKKLKNAGIILDRSTDGIVATSNDEDHVLILGGTGNGKTRRVIIPSIFSIAKTGNSMVLTDPKGELYAKTASQLKKDGYEVMVVDFRNPGKGNRWNPLSIVEDLYRTGKIEYIDKALVILKGIADLLAKNVSNDNDKYWGQAASAVFMGTALAILEYGTQGSLTFENIVSLAHELTDGFQETKSYAKDFFEALPPHSIVKRNLSSLYQPGVPKTMQNITSVLDAMLYQYTNQYALLDFLSRSEVDFLSLGKKPTVLYIVLPDDSTALYPLASIMIKQLYSVLIQMADENVKNNGALDNRVTFLLDEFGTLCETGSGVIQDFPVMMTAARSRGIRFAIVCQSIDQLKKNYTPEEANIISSNCKVWIYMNARDYDFLYRLQKLAGEYSSPYTGIKMPLLSISDLQKMPIGEVLVLNNCCGPYIGHLDDYTAYDFGFKISSVNLKVPVQRKRYNRPQVVLKNLGNDVVRDYKERKIEEEKRLEREKEKERIKRDMANRVYNPFGPSTFIEGVRQKAIPSIFIYPASRKSRDYSLTILDEIFCYKEWKTRYSIIKFAEGLCTKAVLLDEYPEVLRSVFREALDKIERLSWDEMLEIMRILSREDEDEDDDEYEDEDDED